MTNKLTSVLERLGSSAKGNEMTLLVQMLKRHEGWSRWPYKDTVDKLTIGYGRNLDDVGLTKEESEYLLKNDVIRATHACQDWFSWFRTLGQPRKDVIINMVFNMGIGAVRQFKKMIKAIEAEDWELASAEMLDSKWATQVGVRAVELSDMMRSGRYPVSGV